jgi:hypothetical protein
LHRGVTMATANMCLSYSATSWVGINVLVIVVALLIVAAVFAMSSIMSDSLRSRLRAAARDELTQAFISAVIIVVLIIFANAVCGVSQTISMQLTGKSQAPFAYAETYIQGLSLNTGLTLLSNLYTQATLYVIEGQVFESAGNLLNGIATTVIKAFTKSFASTIKNLVVFGIGGASSSMADLLNNIAAFYMGVLAPFVVISIGLLFVQFLALPLFQSLAFTVILPAAIALRTLTFMGTPLKNASNSVLAIAIALYMVYPLMIAFNSYMIAWVFSTHNPSYAYVLTTVSGTNIPISTLLSNPPSGFTSGGIFASTFTSLYNGGVLKTFLGNTYNAGLISLTPWSIASDTQFYIFQVAKFLFTSVILILLDVAVTFAFATGLAKALNSGVNEARSFWSGL